MLFRMDKLLASIFQGMDMVESELVGATSRHDKRIAVLVMKMGQHLGWTDDELICAGACALLHDNALAEYILSEKPGLLREINLQAHCIKGEKNVSYLPFPSNVAGYVLYHHEYMDGSGAFGMNPEDTPIGAQLITIADRLDLHHDLRIWDAERVMPLRAYVEDRRGTYFTETAANAMLAVLHDDLLCQLVDEKIDALFMNLMPKWAVDKTAVELMPIGNTVARITDYKSHFTSKHSMQIANRAHLMARHYKMDDETCAKIYIAASVHDIGKLMIPTKILEKPGKLTDEEYATIQSHVHWSYEMLKDVDGFEDICRWAVTHHRKLNGGGYPTLPEIYFPIDLPGKLIACIDIYQAVRETRPYHGGRSHQETMEVMWQMVKAGEIDGPITADIDRVMACFKTGDGDVPDPQEMSALYR